MTEPVLLQDDPSIQLAAPTDLLIGNVTSDTALLGFTPSIGHHNLCYYIKLTDQAGNVYPIDPICDTWKTLTGLDPATTYAVTVFFSNIG
jgi:hypothetical protein